MPSIDFGWIDVCLGEPSRVSFDGAYLDAAKAAADAALDGGSNVPRVEITSYLPQKQAEVAWTVASAALGAGRDASVLVDCAFVEATKVSDADSRDRVLAWAAIELRCAGDTTRAAKWAEAIEDSDYKPELAAHEVARLAATGDGDGARKTFAALPPMWPRRIDVEFWPGYPRWIGSAAAAACVALASPRFAASPVARTLVEDAERLTANVSEGWRQNREYAALALAWARVGDLERALVATAHMPGTERSRAIVAVLDRFGDAPGVDLDRVAALSRSAIAASRTAPFVIGAMADDAEMGSFIGTAIAAEVVAALVRRYVARGDLAAAKAAADSIPDNLSLHHEARLEVACANKANVDDLVSTVPGGYLPNLAATAARAKCFDVTAHVLSKDLHRDNVANNILRSTIAADRLDDASALLSKLRPYLRSIDLAEIAGVLAFALARSGHGTDALALIKASPVMEYKNTERVLVASGYRCVVALVANGDLINARAMNALLAPRLAHADRMSR